MERWTLEELERTDDLTFAAAILNQRRRTLVRYSPLALKLQQAESTINEIVEEKERFIGRVAAIMKDQQPSPLAGFFREEARYRLGEMIEAPEEIITDELITECAERLTASSETIISGEAVEGILEEVLKEHGIDRESEEEDGKDEN